MNDIIEFNNADIKPLRRFFNLLWLVLLVYTALLLVFLYDGTAIIATPASVHIKTVSILILLATVPATFGWFTMKVKKLKLVDGKEEKLKNYEKVWRIRALLTFIVLLLLITAYVLVLDKSMAFMVAIAALVFMYCRPSAATMKNELNNIPKY